MVLIKRIHDRGANIVVEANGEVLFAPTGDVGQWMNRFSRKVASFSRGYAPTNKRPRWGHYGKPLKDTFTSDARYSPARMKVYAAIGSTSPHAWYVDQGTGVYNGSGPYVAKVLPPWTRGSASLYEHTWIPGGPPGTPVKPVMIKGQKGQNFFDRGLKRGFEFMRMRAFQVPDEGKITKALSSFPAGLANFVGNTPADTAFRASLTEWRSWRDAAFKRNEELGRRHKPGVTRSMAASARAAAAAAKAKAASDLAAVTRAAESRAQTQKDLLREQRRIREQNRKDREDLAKVKRLIDARARGRLRGQKLKNRGYHVILRPIKNAAGTEVIGYDLLYSDLQGVHHVEHFR